MIHMLSAFDLKPDEDEAAFRAAYADFVEELTGAGLIVSAGPLGRRVQDTPMDTDSDRAQQRFSVLTFRDRAQLDAAYDHISARLRPATKTHLDMYRRITNSVFLCWQDQP
jgi:hypothetical protein